MITESIIPEKLKDFEYYKNKLPLYLQNSYGFIEHFRIWYQILINGICDNAIILLNLINIFDGNYFDFLETIEGVQRTSYECDILDKIGRLYGVNRQFRITYEDNNEIKTETILLNNQDFLTLIKTQIIKNYCEGTTEQINSYYKMIGLKMYVLSASEPATAYMYLPTSSSSSEYAYSDNIKKMFLAGLLKIDSMGITYRYTFVDIDRILLWDSLNEAATNGWDGGEWAI